MLACMLVEPCGCNGTVEELRVFELVGRASAEEVVVSSVQIRLLFKISDIVSLCASDVRL